LWTGTWVPIKQDVARTEVYLHAKFHFDPSNRLATIHQRYRQDRTDRTDRTEQIGQRSDSIGRTVLQTVAQKSQYLRINGLTDCPQILFCIITYTDPLNRSDILTRKPRKGAAVIAASMHGFANCRKFKNPDRLTLTLDRVKVTPTYVRVGLPAYPTM